MESKAKAASKYLALILSVACGCATPRTHSIFSLQFSEQPPRALFRSEVLGQKFTTQGVLVLEQKEPTTAKVSVKVPPLEGRVVYSNGQLKKTEDFNWHPKEGFFIWKKKIIRDTFVDLDLGEIAAAFGEWPVAFDVMAIEPTVGLIVTRGILYHRICNDQDVPCSRLVVEFECSGYSKATGPGKIEKCVRLSESSQAFTVRLSGPEYRAGAGARLLVTAPRLGFQKSIPIGSAELASGFIKVETPAVLSGPTLVGFRLVWAEGEERKAVETRVLLVGHDPRWTGLDRPHYLFDGSDVTWVKPVLSDLMEVTSYDGNTPTGKPEWTTKKMIEDLKQPKGPLVQCAFAWSRDSSDLTTVCLNSVQQEVRNP